MLWAKELPHLATFLYIGTATICGKDVKDRVVKEDESPNLNATHLVKYTYTKMKGETEDDIQKVGIKSLHIYRPSILTGERNEHRPMERFATALMKVIDPLLISSWKKYRSIPAEIVAMAMYKQSLKNKTGVTIYTSDKIKELS